MRFPTSKVSISYDTLAVEDDPYSELRYEGEPIQSLQSLAPDNVVHLFTFSKTLAPDFRIGGLVAPKPIRDTAVIIKQGLDLFTSNFNQAVLAKYLTGGYLEAHILEIITLYKPRRNAIIQAIKEFFPDIFDISNPQGGLFIWVALRKEEEKYADRLNMIEIKDEAVKKNVGFVPGTHFFAGKGQAPVSMRLNFSNQTEEKITEGIKVIGEILHKRLIKT